jgi:hypothetical protein
VPKHPTHAQRTDANRHGDASAVADAARLLFDSHEARGRQRCKRTGLLVPTEHLGWRRADDRSICER